MKTNLSNKVQGLFLSGGMVMPERLSSLIDHSDVYFNLKGSTPEEVISSAVRLMRLPKGLDKSRLRAALLERESLASTALGEGFALPHPRHMMLSNPEDALVAVGYLEVPVDWCAPDGLPVTTIFLVLSAVPEQHLSTLSAIARLVQDKSFRLLAAQRPQKKELLEFMGKKGRSFSGPRAGT
ncbi:MAG: PTS sugar transporter subunit IIA [Spirochaetes bacterium]|nr:PTS sugar transporter subunit IIA [Spirochaetota bacterium]